MVQSNREKVGETRFVQNFDGIFLNTYAAAILANTYFFFRFYFLYSYQTMSGSGSGSIPNLQHSESSLSLRTRKSNQDFRVLAAENLGRKGSPLAVDERVFGPTVADDYEERDELLGNGNSEVIEIGNYEDSWQYTSKKDAGKKWFKWLHCSRVWV